MARASWLLVFVALVSGCRQTKRERCIDSENHAANIVIEYWLARPDEWCRDPDIAGSAAGDFAECRAHMTTAAGRAELEKFARIGTTDSGLDVCEKTYKDAFVECRLDAKTYEGLGKCDRLLR